MSQGTMRAIQEAPKPTKLTKYDLDTIKKVYEETKVDSLGEPSLPIICIRGPETEKLFPEGKDGWPVLKMGQTGFVAPASRGVGDVKTFRYFLRLFEGSPMYPKGIPVGHWDRYPQTGVRSGEYALQNSIRDISNEDYLRLRALAYGNTHLTQKQIRRDEAQKNRIRAGRQAPEHNQALELLGQALAAAQANATPTPTPPAEDAA